MKIALWIQNIKETAVSTHTELSQFLKFLAIRAKNDTILRVSSSLSYTSLIALVPFLAIALAIFSAFPIFGDMREQVQNLIVQNFVPSAEQEINTYLTQFVAAAGKLTAIGIIGLVVTAIMLLSTIEYSFNFIFKVRTPRRIATKITLYWTVITLGPLLLGALFSLRGYLYALDLLQTHTPDILSHMLPTLISFLILMMIYVLVPNKKVNFQHAAVGSFTAMVLFWFLRRIFSIVVIASGTYKTLYGAVAIIPISLIWMYLFWSIVIFGAVVTASIGDYKQERLEKSNKPETKK